MATPSERGLEGRGRAGDGAPPPRPVDLDPTVPLAPASPSTTEADQTPSGPPGRGSARGGGGAVPPRLADGVQLLGEFLDSGYRNPPLLARRPDGQIVQLSPLLYEVASRIDGQRDAGQIADGVAEALGRRVSADNVTYLLLQKLAPLGLVAGPDGAQPEVDKRMPLLALTWRSAVVPEGAVDVLARVFQPLFFGPVVAVALGAFVAFDVWLFGLHGVGQGIRQALEQPLLMLAGLGIVVASAALHEVGHAAACRYGGARPGRMGIGLYLVWPVFYTEVTDSYRLGRGGRLRVDLGGVYFNAITVLLLAGAFALTGAEWLLAVILVLHFEIGHQLLPFLRLDGYFIVADLCGVPDLFTRIKPIFSSLVPGRASDERVRDLKPWVRWVVTGWVLLVLPFLAFNIGIVGLNFPRIVATSWESGRAQVGTIAESFPSGQVLEGIAAVLGLIALGLPVLGIGAMFVRLGRQLAAATWRRTEHRPALRVAAVTAVALGVGALGWTWLPDGDYEPIREGERWTAGDVVRAYAEVPSGRPALVPQQRAEARGELGPEEPVGAATEEATEDVTADPTAIERATATDGPTEEGTSDGGLIDPSPSPSGTTAAEQDDDSTTTSEEPAGAIEPSPSSTATSTPSPTASTSTHLTPTPTTSP